MAYSKPIEEAAELIANSTFTVALSGAGISVDSGIPDFRSSGGLWDRYDPMVYANINSFISDPVVVWEMLVEMNEMMLSAKPNAGHKALGKLETQGRLHGIITQNIDGLHQAAGNNNVVEFHGNCTKLACIACGNKYDPHDFKASNGKPPTCKCGQILKPDIIFFGEAIPQDAFARSIEFSEKAEVMLVVGTSATVTPANMLPQVAKEYNAAIIEVNLHPTQLTGNLTDVFLQGSTSDILPELARRVAEHARH